MMQDTHFVVIGAGGLGCPALLALSAAGARHLKIVDPDRVETSNLQRQVLYTVADVGMAKVEAARHRLRRRCPTLQIETETTRLAPEDADAFVAALPPSTVVLGCTDAPELKFALNDAALAHDVPLVVGAALGLRGQAMAVLRAAACYRCIYEAPPTALPGCDTAGVLGPAVGAAGFVMASLALALAEGRPEAAGQLWAIDLSSTTGTTMIHSLHPAPRPGCSGCGGGAHPSPSSYAEPRSAPLDLSS